VAGYAAYLSILTDKKFYQIELKNKKELAVL
jgi:hypothetical protein